MIPSRQRNQQKLIFDIMLIKFSNNRRLTIHGSVFNKSTYSLRTMEGMSFGLLVGLLVVISNRKVNTTAPAEFIIHSVAPSWRSITRHVCMQVFELQDLTLRYLQASGSSKLVLRQASKLVTICGWLDTCSLAWLKMKEQPYLSIPSQLKETGMEVDVIRIFQLRRCEQQMVIKR